MNDFKDLLKNTYRVTLFLLSGILLAWAGFEAYRPYFAGLLLGTIVSMINAQYLAWKVNTAAEAAVKGNGRRVNLGFITRASMGVLAVVLALQFEQHVSPVTTVIGLIIIPLMIFIVRMATLFSNKS